MADFRNVDQILDPDNISYNLVHTLTHELNLPSNTVTPRIIRIAIAEISMDTLRTWYDQTPETLTFAVTALAGGDTTPPEDPSWRARFIDDLLGTFAPDSPDNPTT